MQTKKVIGIVAVLLLSALLLSGVCAADSTQASMENSESIFLSTASQDDLGDLSDSKTDLSDKTISVYLVNSNNEKTSTFTYDGTAVTPKVVIRNTETSEILREGIDYLVTYWNNNSPGTGHVGIVGCGSYTGQIELTFDIEEGADQGNLEGLDAGSISELNTEESILSLSDNRFLKYLVDSANVRSDTFDYTGEAVSPGIIIQDQTNGEILVEGKDYTTVYRENIECGTGYATAIGCGSYTGIVEIPFIIEASSEDSFADNEEEIPVPPMVLMTAASNSNTKGVADHIYVDSPVSMTMGSTKELGAWVVDSTGEWLDYEPVEFSITSGNSVSLTRSGGSDSHYVTLSTTGNSGDTIIEVKSVNHPDITATSTVTVSDISELRINFDCYNVYTSYEQGEKILKLTTESVPGELYGYVTDQYGGEFNNRTLTWTLDDSNVIELISITDESNPTKRVLLKPKAVGTAVVTATLDEDSNVTKSIKIDVSLPTSIEIMEDLPSDVTDEIDSAGGSVYGRDNLGLRVINTEFTVEIVDGEENASITTSEYSDNYYNYSYRVGKYVYINPVEGKSGTSISIKISTNDERFAVKEVTVPVNINAVDNSKTSMSVWYSKYNTTYHTTTDIATQTTSEATCSFSAYIRDQYGYQTNRDIKWEYSGCIPATGSEPTGHSVSFVPQSSGTDMIVTAKDNSDKSSASTTITYTVEETVLTSVYQYISNVNLTLNSTGSANACGRDQYGMELPYDVTWTSSNDSILRVQSTDSGNHYKYASLIPVSKGTATVTASVTQPGSSGKTLSWSADINVEESIVSSVVVGGSTLIPVSSSNGYSLYTNIYDQYGNNISNNSLSVTWNILSGSDVVKCEPELSNTRYCVIKGLKEGTATIQASCEGKNSVETIINVYTPTVNGVHLYFYNEYIKIGDSQIIGVYTVDQHGRRINNDGITVTSSNPNVASVEKNTDSNYWYITGNSEGTVTLEATYGEFKSDTVSVEVYTPVATSIGLGIYNGTMVGVGNNRELFAYVIDQHGYEMSDNTTSFTWSIKSGDDVISLTPSTYEYQKNHCVIKGLKEGTATVTAAYGNLTSNELEITVYSQIATSVRIYDMDIAVNSNSQYYVYLIDQYGYEIDTRKSSITWNIASGNDVISLTPSTSETQKNYCTIKGLKEGTAEITATCDSITSSKGKITVYSQIPTSIDVSSSEYSVGVDYTTNAYAWVLDQKGYEISNPALTWSFVSGNDVISITPSSENQNNCTITGLKEGSATIRVSCDGIRESKDISVTVYQPVPDKLVINRDSINVGSGATNDIYAYLYDQNGKQMKTGTYDCTWTITDDTGEAVIQSSGKSDYNFWCGIKGVSAGSSSIKASISGMTPASCSITVYDRVPTSIQLNEVYISPNSSSYCYAYLVDQFGNRMDSDTILFTWEIVSGEDVISLTPSTSEYQKNYCIINGIKEGSAKISASYGEGESLLTSETDVTVYTPVPSSYYVTSSSSVGVGCERSIDASVWDQYGQWMRNPPVSWDLVSGNDVISITISSDYQQYCTITGLKEGTATIRLSCTGLTETKDITVSVYTQVLNKISINSDLTYIVKDSSSGIYAYLYDQNGNQMKTGSYDCTWTITDGADNVEIISKGKNTDNFWCEVNGISEGDAKIQVSCSDLCSDTCSLSVYTQVPKELNLYNIPYEKIPIGVTNHYYVNMRDQMGRYISNLSVSFEITEGTEHVEIVSTTENSCNLKGISEGTVTLKATCGDLSKTITTEIYTQIPTSVSLSINGNGNIPVGSIVSCSSHINDQYGNSINDKTLEIRFEVIDENECVDYAELSNESYTMSLLGNKEGTVTINATCGTLMSASTNATVYTPSVSRIEVEYLRYSSTSSSEASGSSYELPLTDDYDQKFSIYCYDSNGYRMDDSDISYTWNIIEGNDVIALTPLTDNASECSITCLSEGTAKISVSDGSGLSVDKKLTVYTPKITEFNISGPSNVAIGSSNSTIYAHAYDQYWNQINNADIEFHVDEAGSSVIRLDPVAEETNAVKVVGLSSGSATVTATCGSFSSELSISTYTPEITSLYTSISGLPGIPIGYPVSIIINALDRKGNYSTAFDESVEFVSGTGNVTITKDVEKTEKSGYDYYYNLTGISEGDVTIRVTCGDLSEDFVLPVYTPVLTSLQISWDSITSPAGSDASIQVYGLDQKEQRMDTDMVSCRWQIIEGDDVISISPRFPHNDIIDISLKKNGFAKIQATCGDISSNICLVGCGNSLWGSSGPTVPEEEPAYVVATPTIYPAGGTYSSLPSSVSISSSVSNGKIYYAIDDGYTEEYTVPITAPSGTESFTVHAVVKDEKGVYSKNVTAEYTLGTGPEEEKHTITIAKSAGGTVTSDVSKAKMGDLVTLTFVPKDGYYLAGWTISDGKGTEESKSSTENTFTMWDSDVVITATFEPEEYSITIAGSEGGTVTSDVSRAKTGDLVTLTFTPDTGYLRGNWSVVGDDGATVSKSSSTNTFTMLNQNVTVHATFTQDTTPKPTSVKITNAAGSIYVGDMGTLYATTYDQFGKQYSKDKVTWSSSSLSILSINAADGSYVAQDNGEVTVTATSTEDSSVSGTITITVELPPSPYISGLDAPDTAEYGKMSDDFIVNSENTTYLNWNWGDGSENRTSTNNSTHSVDYVAHTFVPTEVGDVTVKIVPSNSYYAGGEEKTTTINVVYPSPSNVKITEGPSSVVAGDSVSYTGFATGADSYIWSFNGTVLTDQSGSTVSFTVPTNAPSVSTLKLTAVKSGANPISVEKTVYVAQPAAPLGAFGGLTTSPENPAVGEAVVLSITPVENASTYTWVINGMPVSNSNSPSVVYSSSNEGDVSITVTASNSSGTDTKSQNYTYYVGKKPEFTISPESGEGYRGVDVTYKASATYGSNLTWSWAIDGTVKQTSSSDEFTYNWKSDEYGYHVITVKATSDYGTTTKNYSYQVVPKTGVAPEITEIIGSQNLSIKNIASYKAIFACSDAYTISWYLNGELKQEMTSVESGNDNYLVQGLSLGTYTLKVILTTEYEEKAEFSKNISVVESLEPTTADSIVPAGSDMQNIALNDTNSGSTALKNVDTVEIDSGDLSGEAGDVVIEANVVSQDDLKGFTPEMGNKEDTLISIELAPTGLKNEKKLESGAVVTFRLLKSSIGDPDQIGFFRLDTKDEIEKWVKLTVLSYKEEGDYIIFTVKTSGFSTFVATPVAVTQETPEPTTVKESGSSVTTFDGVKSGDDFTFENAVVVTKATLPGVSHAKITNTSGSGWYNFSLTADGFKGNGVLYFQVPLDDISVNGWTVSDVSLLGCKTTYLGTEGKNAKYSAVITKDGAYTIDFEDGAAGTSSGTEDVNPVEVTVSISGVSAMKVGDTTVFSANNSDGSSAKFAWKSSDASIATVDENGNVKALKEGTVTITVTDNLTGKTAAKTIVIGAKATEMTAAKTPGFGIIAVLVGLGAAGVFVARRK